MQQASVLRVYWLCYLALIDWFYTQQLSIQAGRECEDGSVMLGSGYDLQCFELLNR
jgi:hypothetical protein